MISPKRTSGCAGAVRRHGAGGTSRARVELRRQLVRGPGWAGRGPPPNRWVLLGGAGGGRGSRGPGQLPGRRRLVAREPASRDSAEVLAQQPLGLWASTAGGPAPRPLPRASRKERVCLPFTVYRLPFTSPTANGTAHCYSPTTLGIQPARKTEGNAWEFTLPARFHPPLKQCSRRSALGRKAGGGPLLKRSGQLGLRKQFEKFPQRM